METASYLRTDFIVLRRKSKIKYHATVNKVSRQLRKVWTGSEHRDPER